MPSDPNTLAMKRRIDITDECKQRSRERVMADLFNGKLFDTPFAHAAEVVEDWIAELRDQWQRPNPSAQQIAKGLLQHFAIFNIVRGAITMPGKAATVDEVAAVIEPLIAQATATAGEKQEKRS